ncbi:hypothetical protein FEM48_Zijuj12G0020800 [Ziziphus jujuba var. spinosa]|uniref:F-box protein n=1 Tax=Ziziphus jujuba var. spinosa TaxID=714518 RepID=A0A978UAK5_ZIZJJ|nr:hypothetical protein FEM48_Zijuj12G0020800 [Ziziphus jujuba var. spinosa]
MGGLGLNSLPPPLPPPPPWEVMVLVSHRLDPKTLAIASCVCKSWSISMSSDHLWKPICANHFPSLSNLHPTVSYRRLYATAHSSSKHRLQLKTPSKPRLSLADLIFAVNIVPKSCCNSNMVALTVTGDELAVDPNEVFKFDLQVNDYYDDERPCMLEAMEEVKISWNIVLKGWRGVFTMMDCHGKVSFSPGGDGWFSGELPPAGCCCSIGSTTSGIVADLKVGYCTRRGNSSGAAGKVRIEKVSLGILNVLNWRYVTLEDGLRYLQHFLLPFDTNALPYDHILN